MFVVHFGGLGDTTLGRGINQDRPSGLRLDVVGSLDSGHSRTCQVRPDNTGLPWSRASQHGRSTCLLGRGPLTSVDRYITGCRRGKQHGAAYSNCKANAKNGAGSGPDIPFLYVDVIARCRTKLRTV